MRNKCFIIALAFYSITAQANVLRSVEHTLPLLSEAQLEIGSLKLFFDEIPSVQYLPQYGQPEKHTFFFPQVGIDRLLTRLDTLLQNQKNDRYQVEIEKVSKPIEGTKVTLYFEDALIKATHSPFDVIDGRKGVVFHFFNKRLLNQLQRQGKPVLHTACNTRW